MDWQQWTGKFWAAWSLPHPWKNHFHLAMPFGNTLRPAGLIFWKDVWHIFFLWTAADTSSLYWLHTTTRDFVHFGIPVPVSGCEPAPAFLPGCVILQENTLGLWYTRQLTLAADKKAGCSQQQATWSKTFFAEQPLPLPSLPDGYRSQLQNPYLFVRQGQRYLLFGAQAEDGRGCILLAREQDDGWEFLGELRTQLGSFGHLWEQPQLLRFGDHDVLFLCAQGVTPKEYDCQNLCQAGYLVGQFSSAAKELLHGSFQELDRGFDFYAPQISCHEGRILLLGWMGMPGKEAQYPAGEAGCRYTMTLPRELRLRRGHIYAEPARELKDLRLADHMQEFAEEDTAAHSLTLPNGAEVFLSLQLGHAQLLTISLVYGEERLLFRYDRTRQLMQINRMGMHRGGRGVRTFRLYSDDVLLGHFFIDKTAVEVFFQNGEQTAAIQVFPEKDILPKLTLQADAVLPEVTGCVWQLDTLHFTEQPYFSGRISI